MLKTTATVTKVDGDLAWVHTRRQSTCGSCTANKNCGVSFLDSFFKKSVELKLNNVMSAQVGDEVEVGVQEQVLITGSLLVYLVPLLFMFGFAVLGEYLSAYEEALLSMLFAFDVGTVFIGKDVMSIIFAFAGLAAGFYFIRVFSQAMFQKFKFQDSEIQMLDLKRPGRDIT